MVDLSDLKRQVFDEARRRVDVATRRMTDDLKTTAPVDTGELRRKTGVEITSASAKLIRAEAVVDVEYAEPVVMGSRPHMITAKPGRTLAFYWPKVGRTVFFKHVNHPGTSANPFFEQVTSAWKTYLDNAR